MLYEEGDRVEVNGREMSRMSVRAWTEQEENVLEGVLSIIKQIRRVHGTLTVHHLEAYLEVALHEGETVSDYQRRSGVAQSVMSRHLLNLSDTMRGGGEGLGLLERRRSLENLKFTEYKLSPKGRALAKQIANTLLKGAKT